MKPNEKTRSIRLHVHNPLFSLFCLLHCCLRPGLLPVHRRDKESLAAIVPPPRVDTPTIICVVQVFVASASMVSSSPVCMKRKMVAKRGGKGKCGG